jgi:hypothetical protein
MNGIEREVRPEHDRKVLRLWIATDTRSFCLIQIVVAQYVELKELKEVDTCIRDPYETNAGLSEVAKVVTMCQLES